MKVCVLFIFFCVSFISNRKLTLKDAVDYLEQLIDDEEDENFLHEVDAVYIEPPDEDGNVSGEDDANENEGGTVDALCRGQLSAGCEIVLRNGHHTEALDFQQPTENESEKIETVLVDVIYESQVDLSNDQPHQIIQHEQMEIDEEEGAAALPIVQLPTITIEPWVNRLRRVSTTPSDVPLPAGNKETKFKWLKKGDSAAVPVFPESNFNDCREVPPHELFERFYDDELLQHICDCTVRYSVLHLGKPITIDVDELRAFIGILLVTGYNTVSSYRAYWNNGDDLRNEMIYKTMRRNRFEEILRALHFEPDLHAPENNKDKLWKLRPIMDHLKANFLKNFHPTRNLSYDESMIAYYGKHGCKQFIKGKPIRFGYKVWSLCTSSGYLVNFEIYQGNNPRAKKVYEDRFGKCSAPLVSMIDDFSDEVKGLPFSFFFDNLFTGFPLLAYVKARGYNATGTMRENRIVASCPITSKQKFKKKKRGTFEVAKMADTGIRVTQWVDNSSVIIASTCFGAEPTSTAVRYSKEAKSRVNVIRPCAITEYNKYMAGVDRLDQNVNNHRIGYRGKKWWSSIFTWLIDAAVNNAWQLYRGSKNMPQLDFKREIATYYCKHYGTLPAPSGPKRQRREDALTINIRYDDMKHFVVPITSRRRCANESCKSSVRTICQKCDVGLCLPCFADYHTRPTTPSSERSRSNTPIID